MREKWPTVVIVVAVCLFLLTYLVVFQVRINEVAIQYRSGRVLRAINTGEKQEAGWYFKLPWPIDTVTRYDKRVRVLDGKLTQTQLSDNWNVVISMYGGWRITDPVKFKTTLKGDLKTAEITLKDKIFDATSQAVGKMTIDNLVCTDAQRLSFEELEQQVTEAVRHTVEQNGYGIDICSFGIRRIAIPEGTTQKVFERMRAEREKYAKQYRAEGSTRSEEIIEKAKSERDKKVAEALAEAKRIRSEGEAAEARYFHIFARAPELANFLRDCESLKNIAEEARNNGQSITFVLTERTPPFSRITESLTGSGSGSEAPASEGTEQPTQE